MIRAALREISPRLAAALGDGLAKQIMAGYRHDDLTLTEKAVDAILLKLADDKAFDEHLTELAVDEIEEEKKRKECEKEC